VLEDITPSACAACRIKQHWRCDGWVSGWCGCTAGLCGLRLITRVMWDIHDTPNGKEHP